MAYEIEVKELPVRRVATIRVQITPDQMGATFMELLPEVHAFLQGRGVEPTGPGFGIFHSYESDSVDMEAGFPTPEPMTGEGRIVGRTLDAATFAVTWHNGSYQTIGEAHRAIEQWTKDKGRDVVGPPWEVYREGPESGKSASEYRTEVGYPIR